MVSSSSSLTSGTLPSSPSFFSNDRSLPSLNPIAPSPSLPAIRSSALAVTSRSKGRRCLIRRMNVSKGDGSETAPSDMIFVPILEDGVFRFDSSVEHRNAAFPSERFPDPSALAKHLHNNGFKAIWMLDPGIKQEEGFDVYDSGSKNNVWVKGADGEPFIGEVWPGPCVFPDYTNSKARSWWANLVKDFISNGVDGIWNDMNEPAVFKVVTKTMPENNIHRGDDELGGVQYHSHYHNVYGMLMARSTYEGMELADKNKRPFVLTRAGFIGSQRYAATWTGDNLSTWEHLHMSISMVLQLVRISRAHCLLIAKLKQLVCDYHL
ncbi:hypothetical protein F2Q70_00036600 [Brassica cretica]|uniref:Glycoside hydrolase family 31 TIM barrel domain-containing protein n=1 Tax=Brassica cretica TaxID=69181 RepID=A0A8S9JS98_BRACR|nr:hypothetical protein F2Q70_00036600 [Brassica cretica]